MASPVLEISPLFVCFQNGQFFHFDHGLYIVHGGQKINSAQKIHANRGSCEMHANQFWWAWLLRFWRFCLLSKRPIFPFRPWTIVHGGQKINSAQKIHANRGSCEMHANQFWWAWLLRFRRFCLLSKWPIFPSRPWTIVHGGQKNKFGSKNSCR